MLDAEEVVELRALQARAYGRDGELEPREAARLRELSARRRPEAGHHAGSGDPQRHAAEGTDDESEDSSADEAAEVDAGSTGALRGAPAKPRRFVVPTRSRWLLFALALVVALCVGAAAGWWVRRPADVTVVLTPKQQEWQAQIESAGEYDPGSVQALAVESEVVVWTATKDDGESVCLVFRGGEQTVPTCDRALPVRSAGLYGAITVEIDGDVRREVSARLSLTPDGQPAITTSSYIYVQADDGMRFADGPEAAVAERLRADGYAAGSLMLLGKDGDITAWSAVDTRSGQRCLILDGDDGPRTATCDIDWSLDRPGGMLGVITEDAAGATTRYEYREADGVPSLLIIHDAEGGEQSE